MKEKNSVWSKWEIVERTLTDASWEPTRYAGSLPTANDSIYRYTETINLIFPPGERVNGRVYAIASVKQLTLSKDLSAITDLNDLLELTFDASSVDIQKNLQHIYSSPYNLNINGDYFGAFNSTHQKVPHLNMLLYHVAAKVDIKWSVAEDKRIDRVTPANGVRRCAIRWRICRLPDMQSRISSLRRTKDYGGKAEIISTPFPIP